MVVRKKETVESVCLATMAELCFADHDYLMNRIEACANDCPEIRSHMTPITGRIGGKTVPTYVLDRVGAYLFFGWAFFEGVSMEEATA